MNMYHVYNMCCHYNSVLIIIIIIIICCWNCEMALFGPVQPNMLLPTEHVDQRTNQVGLSSSLRALCPMCHCSMPVTRAGQMRVHGPLRNRCGGSGMSPSSTAPATRESSSVVQDGPPSQTLPHPNYTFGLFPSES